MALSTNLIASLYSSADKCMNMLLPWKKKDTAKYKSSNSRKICKRCLFKCDMEKYSTRSMNKVWTFRRTPYSLVTCCMFPDCPKNEHCFIFSHSVMSVTHDTTAIHYSSIHIRVRYIRLIVKTTTQNLRINEIFIPTHHNMRKRQALAGSENCLV